MQKRIAMVALAALATVIATSAAARAAESDEKLLTPDRMEDIVTIRDVSVRDGQVSGVVENRSANTLRNVRLRIRDMWLWNHEFRPGEDDMSRVDFYTVPEEIPPHGSVRFTAPEPAGAPARTDGHFETVVTVADVESLSARAEAPAAGME